MFIRQLSGVRDQLRAVTVGLDPEVMHGRDAAEALRVCAEIERLAAGARTLLAARVEETRAWAGAGKTSAAHWLAEQAGTSVGEAVGVLRTGKRLIEQPEVRHAVQHGALSPKQAELVSQGAAADPAATGTLLDLAGKASLGELREESQRTIAAAEVDEMAAYRRVRRSRFWRHRRDADGAWVGTIRTTPDSGALLMAGINAARPAIFDAARRSGHWDPSEAYDADALVALAASFLGTPPPTPDGPHQPTGNDQDTEPPRTRTTGGHGGPDEHRSSGHDHRATDGGNARDEGSTIDAVAAVLELFPGVEPVVSASSDAYDDANTAKAAKAATKDLAESDDVAAGASRTPAAARSVPVGGRPRPMGSRTPLVVRVDHAALVRGRTRRGECCEITGIGSVPVEVVRALLPRAFIAAVTVDRHGQPVRVAHLGRRSRAARAAGRQHAPPGHSPPEASSLGPNTKVIVAVPECALTEANDEPIIDALRQHGLPVIELTHHKRHFTARQRTVLEYRDPQCTVLGCTATARLERDHRDDWAHTHTTDAACADHLCDPHHDLKTRHGWRLEPGTSKRRILPPGQ